MCSEERRATKYITGDYISDYKSRLVTLNILPFMYFLELSDIMFFVNSVSIPVQTLTFLILYLLVLPKPGLQLSINYVTLNLLLK